MVPLGENRRRHCKFCSIYVDATEGNGVLGVRIEERLLENEQNKMIFVGYKPERNGSTRSTEKLVEVMKRQLLVRLNPDLLSIRVTFLLSYKYVGSVSSASDASMAAFVLVRHQQLFV